MAAPGSVNVADRSAAPPETTMEETTHGMECQTTPAITTTPVRRMRSVQRSREDEENPPAKKVRATPLAQGASSYPTPLPQHSFRVHIKPEVQYDITSVPTRYIQREIDLRLNTIGYQGFVSHRASNHITVHLANMEDVVKICGITQIPIDPQQHVNVQAYFASGPNVQRCVAYNLDKHEPPETVANDLRSTTHTVLAARRMGNNGTFLLTVQGPQTLPEKFYYNGCLIRPKEYRPRRLYCYRCFREGHIQKACPQDQAALGQLPEKTQLIYTCGLCKSDDHDITSPKCPAKRRRNAMPTHQFKTPVTFNRYSALTSDAEYEAEELDQGEDLTLTYSEIAKTPRRSKRHRLPPFQEEFPVLEERYPPSEDIDKQIEQMARQLEQLKQRRARVTERREKAAMDERSPRNTGERGQSRQDNIQRPKSTPTNDTLWAAVLDTLGKLTQLIQAGLNLD